MQHVAVPGRVANRLVREIRTFQRILAGAGVRGAGERETASIVADMLGRAFGFDRRTELVAEHAMRGTHRGLVVRFEGRPCYVVEVKAIGVELDAGHRRLALSYGAHRRVPWTVLTNGRFWQLFRVDADEGVEEEPFCAWDVLELFPGTEADQRKLYLLCREGVRRTAIEEYHERARTVNPHSLCAILQSDPVVDLVRAELRRISPQVRITASEVRDLMSEVLKSDVLNGSATAAAARSVAEKQGRAAWENARGSKAADAADGGYGPAAQDGLSSAGQRY